MFDKFQQGKETLKATPNDQNKLQRLNYDQDFQRRWIRTLLNNSETKIEKILPKELKKVLVRLESVHFGTKVIQQRVPLDRWKILKWKIHKF